MFGYLDETGLLRSPATDRIFGLGLLTIHHPSTLHRMIVDYKNSHRYHEEVKFSNLSSASLSLFKGFIDLFFRCSATKFRSVFYDKQLLTIDVDFGNDYDKAYNAFVGRIIAQSLEVSDYIVVIADDVSTKRNDNFEKQIKAKVRRKARRNALFGICRVESHAISEIQLVDLILGTISYAFKMKYGLVGPGRNSAKYKLVKHLQKKLGIKSLTIGTDLKLARGMRFSIEEYIPQKK